MEKKIMLAGRELDLSEPVVMGILNVTPDSFYDGGRYMGEAGLVERVDRMVEEGAGIIDVGAYSTRPGADYVDEKEELARLSWAVELVRRYHPHAVVSIDTFRAKVAREIISCLGPVIVNDISGGTLDEGMFPLVAETGMPYVLMHIKGEPRTMQQNPVYGDVVAEVREFLAERVRQLNALGTDNIILDPGYGFGKTLAHNYRLFGESGSLLELGYPILTGISRKSMIFRLLGGGPGDALNGTTALNMAALMKGSRILRVHDVKEAVEAVKIFQAFSSSACTEAGDGPSATGPCRP